MRDHDKETKHLGNLGRGPKENFGWATRSQAQTLPSIAALVQPTLYATHQADGTIKIGHTTRLNERLRKLGGIHNLLALKLGTRQDETRIHAQLKPHLAHSREYYEPTKEIFALINEWRADMNLKPIDPRHYR